MFVYMCVHVYFDLLSGFVCINPPNDCDICKVEQRRRALRGHKKKQGVRCVLHFSEQEEPIDTLVSYDACS